MDNKGKRKSTGNRPSVYNQWVDMSIAPKTSKWRLSQRNATSPESFSVEGSLLPQEDYSMFEDPLTTQHSEDVSSFEDAYLAEVKRSSVVDNDKDNMAGSNWDSLLKNIALEESDEESSDESLEDEVMEETEKEMEEPIYEGHSMPCYVSMLLVITYAITHTITGAQFSDLLVMLSLHCLTQPRHLKSIYALKKYFSSTQNPLIIHKYCSFCFLLIDNGEQQCKNCLRNLEEQGSTACFIEIPIIQQLRDLFQKTNFISNIQKRFKRKQTAGVYSDIMDGKLYRKLSQNNGPLSSEYPYNISFTWNTDGVPVFKSSNFSLWPFFLSINELPYKERIKKENMIFAGLWYGPHKPFMLSFCKPIHGSILKLEQEGVTIEVTPGCEIVSRCFLLCGTCDLPAKALVCNCVQYNGKYGCDKCLQPGKTCKTSSSGHTHVFPFIKEDPDGPKRTHVGTIGHSKQATVNGKPVFGIKGLSVLNYFTYYDVIQGTTIDYMHCVLQGACKLLLNLWFSPAYAGNIFSVSSEIDTVNKRLLEIKPPDLITWVPRSLEDRRFWKASELRSWLLFYSFPCLFGIFAEECFQHLACFVEALWLMLQDSITEHDLLQSERLLIFVRCLEQFTERDT